MALNASSTPYWFLQESGDGDLTLSSLHRAQAHLIPKVRFI